MFTLRRTIGERGLGLVRFELGVGIVIQLVVVVTLLVGFLVRTCLVVITFVDRIGPWSFSFR